MKQYKCIFVGGHLHGIIFKRTDPANHLRFPIMISTPQRRYISGQEAGQEESNIVYVDYHAYNYILGWPKLPANIKIYVWESYTDGTWVTKDEYIQLMIQNTLKHLIDVEILNTHKNSLLLAADYLEENSPYVASDIRDLLTKLLELKHKIKHDSNLQIG